MSTLNRISSTVIKYPQTSHHWTDFMSLITGVDLHICLG